MCTAIGAPCAYRPRAGGEIRTSSPSVPADFDGTYKAQMARVLRRAAAAHRAFEASGDSPTLRPVARFAAPVCEKNLTALTKL